MGKNWLIRTKSNHILGPVSKDKVLELYKNGSIKQDDEICSGNGYWFFIRESDLVDRYLLGDGQQSFNPISEAKDVLTSSGGGIHEPTRDDITMVGGIDLGKIKESAAPKPEPVTAVHKIDTEGLQKKKIRSESLPKQSVSPQKPAKQQSYFKYLGIFVFLILVLVIYFRKSILKSFFNSEAYLREIPSLIMTPAYAQNDSPEKKKTY